METKQYPQLTRPEMHENMDSDEYEFAKFEAIQKPSEKEYLGDYAVLEYVNEFEFRYNNRMNPDIFGAAIRACQT